MNSLFQENQMVPLSQRRALLKYCGEQYRKSNTTYQESVRLMLWYWQSNITIALQILRYLYCNIGIAYWTLTEWNYVTVPKKLKNKSSWYNTDVVTKLNWMNMIRPPAPGLVLESSLECSQPSETGIDEIKREGAEMKNYLGAWWD